MIRVASPKYQARLKRLTRNFLDFSRGHRHSPRIGRSYVFVYPDFGAPVGYPKHLAHRFHVAKVVKRIQRENARAEQEAVLRIRTDDGWIGSVFASELFPMEKPTATARA